MQIAMTRPWILNVLKLEDAVRKMTPLPAQILGLHDRGFIREGYRGLRSFRILWTSKGRLS